MDSVEEETDGDGGGDYGVSAVSCLCIYKRGLLRCHPTEKGNARSLRSRMATDIDSCAFLYNSNCRRWESEGN